MTDHPIKAHIPDPAEAEAPPPVCGFSVNRPQNPAPRRTIVILGTERGGTSAIAGTVRALGVDLGADLGGNNEDKAISNSPPRKLEAYVKQRNAQNDIWGWKFPRAAKLPPVLFEMMRNPFYIVVTRDPVRVALSREKWDGPRRRHRAVAALNDAIHSIQYASTLALGQSRPTLFVSYEMFCEHRADGINEIADFIGLARPDADLMGRIIAYTEPGSYKDFSEFFGAKAA